MKKFTPSHFAQHKGRTMRVQRRAEATYWAGYLADDGDSAYPLTTMSQRQIKKLYKKAEALSPSFSGHGRREQIVLYYYAIREAEDADQRLLSYAIG